MSKTPVVYHPGEYVREEMKARGWGVRELAWNMTGKEAELPNLVQICKSLMDCKMDINKNIALRLGKALGTSASMWLKLQSAWDQWRLEQEPSRYSTVYYTVSQVGEYLRFKEVDFMISMRISLQGVKVGDRLKLVIDSQSEFGSLVLVDFARGEGKGS